MTANAEVLAVEDLAKSFNVYKRPIDALLEALTRRQLHTPFWALEDVSFGAQRGEVLGIIGRNGAGKSTLLKIIAGTLTPTRGYAHVTGRVAAILELGAGFNVEQSGQDNIVLGGLCMGLSRDEVDAKYDEIVAFSELGSFIKQPVRTYSTGMMARLAFAVATAVEPDVLIVDEALSVGDAKFQKKSFARFEEFRERGKTILFVTHNTPLIEMVCTRAIYLEGGRIKQIGDPKDVVAAYNRDLFGPEGNALPVAAATDDGVRRYGTGGVIISHCAIEDEDGRALAAIPSGAVCVIRVQVDCVRAAIDDLNVGVSITTKEGVRLFAINPILAGARTPSLVKGNTLEVHVRVRMNLGGGDYFVTVGAWGLHEAAHYDRRIDVLHFRVFGSLASSQSIVNLEPDYSMTVLQGNLV
jgi:lipopolysaccharide transport system ATP-binding protein